MNQRVIWGAMILLASAAVSWPAQRDVKNRGEEAPVDTSRNNATSPAAGKEVLSPAATDPAYLIGPEDVLDVTVWKEPDASRVEPVRPDGRISLPLIHDVQAAGLTAQELTEAVTEKLRKYINDPQVTVIVKEMNSQRVFVVGEVLRAGAFPLIPGMTVLQALASAGGFTTFADVKKIHVVRLRAGKQIELPFNYRDVLKGDNPAQNIKLERGDTIVVP
jgi:polysaccharide biosynthesis/export protein